MEMLDIKEWFKSYDYGDIFLYPDNPDIDSWNTHKIREIISKDPQILILSFSEADWGNDYDDSGYSFWMFSFLIMEGYEQFAIAMIDNDIIEYETASQLIARNRRIKVFNRIKPHIHPTKHNIVIWISTYPEHKNFLRSSIQDE